MSKILKIIIIIVLVLILAISGIKVIKKTRKKEASLPVAKVYPISVKSMKPIFTNVKLTLPYLSEVENDKDVSLASRIASRVQYIKKSGEKVKKGEIVVRLDTTQLESNLRSIKDQIKAAKISLKNIELTHQRTQKLLNVHGASIEMFQKEQSQIALAKAKLSSLEQKEIDITNNLSYTTIKAPVDGMISKTFVNVGDISAPTRPLVQISSTNGFYLLLRVPTDIKVQSVFYHDKYYKAIPLNKTVHGLAEYKVYLNQAGLISGDRVEVSVVIFNKKAIKLPFDAILDRDGKSYVLVINKDKAIPKRVHILQTGEEGVSVSDDLTQDEIVIAKPDILLKLLSGYKLVKGK